MFKIHSAPRALLAMFGMKNEGRNPPDMPENIQCTADVLDNYLNEYFGRTSSGATTQTAPATSGQVTVSTTAGYMWRVWGVASLTIVAAGDIAIDSMHTLELVTSGGAIMPLTAEPYVFTASFQARRYGFWFPTPIIVRPGVNFRATTQLASAPASDWTVETVIYSQAVPE